MMPNRFFIAPDTYSRVYQHLLQNETEQVAFVFAQVVRGNDGVTFKADECYLAQPEDFDFQSDYHVSLTDEAQARVIKLAWEYQAALVEFHSHTDPRHAAQFSLSDFRGISDWVPHVWWRLKGQPYLAIVVGPRNFDALVWRMSPRLPEELHSFQVGGDIRRPTGLSIAKWNSGGAA